MRIGCKRAPHDCALIEWAYGLSLGFPGKLTDFLNACFILVQEKLRSMAVVFFLNMLLYAGLECNLLFLAQLRFGFTG